MTQAIDNSKIRDARITYPEMEVKIVFLCERFHVSEGKKTPQPSKSLTLVNSAMNPLATFSSLLNCVTAYRDRTEPI